MADLPTGIVTFFLTDVEGSSALWAEHRTEMARALARHDQLIADAVDRHDGVVLKSRGEGDSAFAVFHRASDALAAACDLQRGLMSEPWPQHATVKVRIGVHSGETQERDGDYYGPVVNRCARIRDAAHGGQVLVSRATHELAWEQIPADMRLRSLGSHRLPDLLRSEEIYQLEAAGLVSEFAPIRTLARAQHYLPVQLTSFVGRRRESAEIRRLVNTNRHVTLVGLAGSGKTRLALDAAAALLDEFPDGVWFVDLSPISSPSAVPAAILRVLDVPDEPSGAPREWLCRWIAAQKLLLVLDNCEHVIDGCADLVGALLTTCAAVRVLATSREALEVPGECLYRVPPLSLPSGRARTAQDLLRSDAVCLLLERAALQHRPLNLATADGENVARLCSELDGLPLAIELAAARLGAMPVAEIAERIASDLSLLGKGPRGGVRRHETLRAAIDWSHELLTPAQQAVFRRLAVFGGSFSIPAAEAATAGDAVADGDVAGLLVDLVGQSMVSTVEEPQGRARFVLLRVMRDYALERLRAAGEAEVTGCRHARHYLALAEEAGQALTGPKEAEWLDRLELEQGNFAAAIGWAGQHDADTGLRIVIALWRFWCARGHLLEARDRLDSVLAAAGSEGNAAVRADALCIAGNLAYHQGDIAAARSHYARSLQLARSLADDGRTSRALNMLGLALSDLGQYAEARVFLEQSLRMRQELGDARLVAATKLNLVRVAQMQGEYPTARAWMEEVLATDRQVAGPAEVAGSLRTLGEIALDQGDFGPARAWLEESLRIRSELGDLAGVAETQEALAMAELRGGNVEAAARLADESLQASRDLDNEWGAASAIGTLADIAYARWQLQSARKLAEESLRLWRAIGNMDEIDRQLARLAVIASAQGDAATARRCCRELTSEADRSAPSRFRADALVVSGDLAQLAGDPASARGPLREGLRMYCRSGDASGCVLALEHLASAESELGEVARSARLFGAAAARREQLGLARPPVWRALHQPAVDSCRQSLGEAAFAAAYAEGRALAIDDAIRLATTEPSVESATV